jgi:hypothetical protein
MSCATMRISAPSCAADGIFDRVFDQRLQQQRGQQGLARGQDQSRNRGPQPLLEAHPLDVEIELQRLDLLRHRDRAVGSLIRV